MILAAFAMTRISLGLKRTGPEVLSPAMNSEKNRRVLF